MPFYPNISGSHIGPGWPAYVKRPFYLVNRHWETIIPSVFFKSPPVNYQREEFTLSDDDFIDIDWIRQGSETLVILSHGLEGSTDRYYIKRSAAYFRDLNYDVLAWNNRGCSGRMNRKLKFYHHGDVDDISQVVEHALSFSYKKVFLVGFSMGGSHVSKYLCTAASKDSRLLGGIAFSVSSDMRDSTKELARSVNNVYRERFLKKIKSKAKKMKVLFPEDLPSGIDDIDNFPDFHRAITVPVNNFRDVDEFFYQASPNNFLNSLGKPLLMVNALNDPILGPKCYPEDQARTSEQFSLYTPKYGGHLGFNFPKRPFSYMELIAGAFLTHLVSE